MTEKQHKPGGIMRDDPLAWLTEAPGENPFEPAPPKAVAAAPAPALVVEAVVAADSDDDDEGQAWGLFEGAGDRTPAVEAHAATTGESGDGWGLFDAGQPVAETVATGTADAEAGWGLFEAAPVADRCLLSLGSALMLQDVDAARSEWLAQLGGDAFEIDAADVERVDAAGMQLLCALALSERQHGRSLSWRTVSPSLRGAAADLGMSKLLGLAA